MIKYIDLPTTTLDGGLSVKVIGNSNMEKTASYENLGQEMQDYLRTLKSKAGKIYVLAVAMGDQNWGSNRNADFFPTLALNHEGEDYGYKTFEMFAKWFHHHQNKDPKKSFGQVEKSVWNDKMNRVELIIEVDMIKDPATVTESENGYPIEISMGAKVGYDICQICHPNWKEFYKIPEKEMRIIAKSSSIDEIHNIGKKHNVDLSYITELNEKVYQTGKDGNAIDMGQGPIGISSTTKKYCKHMTTMRNMLMPSGKRVCVINLRPVFFDISKVGTNADKSAFVLAKVANDSSGERMSELEIDKMIEKKSETKQAEIEKRIDGETITSEIPEMEQYYINNILPELYKREKELPKSFLNDMGKHPIQDVLSSFLAMGMFPHPREFQRIILVNKGKEELADRYDSEGMYITDEDAICNMPLQGRRMNFSRSDVNNDIIDKLVPFALGRSHHRPMIVKRITIINKEAEYNEFLDKDKPSNNPLPPTLMAIAAMYGLAKITGSKELNSLITQLGKNKKQVATYILGAALANQAIHTMTDNPPQQEKYAAVSNKSIAKMVGIPLATYLYAGHVVNKEREGTQTSKPSRWVATHPGTAAVGATLLGVNPSRKALKAVLQKGMEYGSKLLKVGMDSNGLNIEDYPEQDRDGLIISLIENKILDT